MNVAKGWAEMARLFSDWWLAQEDRAFLTSNGADEKGSFYQSARAKQQHILPSLTTRLPPKPKSPLQRRARKQSALRRTPFRSHRKIT